MPSAASVLLALATAASIVSAHGIVSKWSIGGTTYRGFDEQWNSHVTDEFIAWADTDKHNGYISPDLYASSDIICHRGGSNGKLNNATVAAGSKISATWNTWPDWHHGPVIDYIAPADDPTTVDKTTLKFLKIQEKGLISGSNPGTWASDELIDNDFTHEITIPADLKPGNYVLRTEIISLHAATEADGAQNYPQCVNLQVTGSGTELPTGTLGEKLYTSDEAGITFNLYTTFDSYTIPGPALAFGSGSSNSSSTAAAVTSTAVATSSAAAIVESVTATAAVATSSTIETAQPTSSTSSATTAAPTKPSCKKRRHARQLAHN